VNLREPGGAERGEGGLTEDSPSLTGGQEQIGMGRTQLGRDLFGENHRHPQQLGGRSGQEAATQATLAVLHGLQEGRLDVDHEQGDAGGRGFGHACQTARDSQ